MKKNISVGSVTVAALCGILALQACGKGAGSRAVPLRSMDQGGPIPAGKSVSAVNTSLIGTFIYSHAMCRAANGDESIADDAPNAGAESMRIDETTLVWNTSNQSGCQVISTYQILGIDKSSIAIGNRQMNITLNGAPANAQQCADAIQPMGSQNYVRFDYILNGGDFARLQSPTEPCQSDEKNEFVYYRP